jgi:hypothetical protein
MGNPYMTAPFRQAGAANVIAANGTSQRAALARAKDQNVVVSNEATLTCFVNFGTVTNTASSADAAVLAGQSRIFGVTESATHVAVVLTAAGPGNVYVACGDGI